MVFLAPPQRARPENTTTYLIHTSKITCSACVGRTTTTPAGFYRSFTTASQTRTKMRGLATYRRLPRPLLQRLAAFEESSGWWSTSPQSSEFASSSARKSLTAQAGSQRTRGTLQHSALTTASRGEGLRPREQFKCQVHHSRCQSAKRRADRALPKRIELSRDEFLVARIAP